MANYRYSFKINAKALNNLDLLQRFIYLKLARFKKKNNILKIQYADVVLSEDPSTGEDDLEDRLVTVTIRIQTLGMNNN